MFKKMCKQEDSVQPSQQPNSNFENELTLKKLYLWTLGPIERMKWLAVSCDAIASKSLFTKIFVEYLLSHKFTLMFICAGLVRH